MEGMRAPGPADPVAIKLLLMGDSGTGKSSILLRFTEDAFLGEHRQPSTIGVDFKIKFVEKVAGRDRIKLTIWDTAGQERFRSLSSSYYRGAQGVIIVYDVTRRDTFDALRRDWLPELETYADLDQLVLMLVGNKIDLHHQRQVSADEGRALARSLAALFMETSAKTSVGVAAAFEELVQKVANTPHFWQRAADQQRAALATVAIDAPEDDREDASCAC